MKLQTSEDYVQTIQDYGCYLLDIIRVAELYTGQEWDAFTINTKFYELERFGHVLHDCTVLHPEEVFKAFGVKAEYNNRHDQADALIFPGQAAIGKFHNPETGLSHFAVLSGEKSVLWDSLGGSISIRDGYLDTLRIFTLKGVL